MTMTPEDSSYALQAVAEHINILEAHAEEYQRARIFALGLMPCKGILLDAATDDWSGCDTRGGTLTDCPSCHGSGFMHIPQEAPHD